MSTAILGFLLAVYMTFAVHASIFRSPCQEIKVLVGNDVTMECTVHNLGELELVIWQNGSIVLSAGRQVYQPPESNKVSIEGRSGDTFNLRIRNVTVYDEGIYSCQVTGRGTQCYRLIVNVPASIGFFFPEGTTITVEDEGVLNLSCRGYGNPEPSIQWIYHGQEEPLEIAEQGDKENVTFPEIHRSHAGEYECRATNGIGAPASRKIQIEVEYAPFLANKVSVIYVAPGQDAVIECFFCANPDVESVTWYHNDSKLHSERQTNVKEDRRKIDIYDVWALHIREMRPDQLGIYICLGENKIGTVYETIKLSPLPHDLKIIDMHKNKYSDQYTLRWIVSSPMKLLNFIIAIKQLNDSFKTEWHNFSTPVSVPYSKTNHSQEYTFQQLAVNASYTILIRARNQYGYSDWSEGLTIHTSEEFDEVPFQFTTSAMELELTISNESLSLKESSGTFAEPMTLFFLVTLAFLLLNNMDAIC